METIVINGISIEPSAPKPALAALSLDNATAKSSDYIIVQTKQPLNKTQRGALAKAGAEIIESVPGHAYICHFLKTNLERVRALEFVGWAEVYPQAVKISPALGGLRPQRGGVHAATMASASPGALDDARKTVDVVLHRNIDAKKAAKRIAVAAHLSYADVEILPARCAS